MKNISRLELVWKAPESQPEDGRLNCIQLKENGFASPCTQIFYNSEARYILEYQLISDVLSFEVFNMQKCRVRNHFSEENRPMMNLRSHQGNGQEAYKKSRSDAISCFGI